MSRARRAALVLAAALVGGAGACDLRSCLAQSEAFAGLRPQLIDECCTCLAHRGTRFPGAACAESFIEADGGLAIVADAGPGIPADAPDVVDDNNDTVDPGEIPCMCNNDLAQCKTALTAGTSILVTGACINQGGGITRTAPCENECDGVLTFDPLTNSP